MPPDGGKRRQMRPGQPSGKMAKRTVAICLKMKEMPGIPYTE
jgi:hypothetical protein